MKVYLAGGFRSGWQDKVMKAAPIAYYLDPSQSELTDPKEYTKWDLDALDRCDVVFAYMEGDNPGGYALSLEVGYAKALGKIIIFINEKNEIAKYMAMVEESASFVYTNIIDGAAKLRELGKLKW